LSQLKCEYCDGLGHLGTDTVQVKLGKRKATHPIEAKIETIGKDRWATYTDRCPLKHKLELSMLSCKSSMPVYT